MPYICLVFALYLPYFALCLPYFALHLPYFACPKKLHTTSGKTFRVLLQNDIF